MTRFWKQNSNERVWCYCKYKVCLTIPGPNTRVQNQQIRSNKIIYTVCLKCVWGENYTSSLSFMYLWEMLYAAAISYLISYLNSLEYSAAVVPHLFPALSKS